MTISRKKTFDGAELLGLEVVHSPSGFARSDDGRLIMSVHVRGPTRDSRQFLIRLYCQQPASISVEGDPNCLLRSVDQDRVFKQTHVFMPGEYALEGEVSDTVSFDK